MAYCDDFQELLLDSLYGLLEPAEHERLRQHVEQCALCQAARIEAQRQQQMLARAAQVCATVPLFSPPVEAGVGYQESGIKSQQPGIRNQEPAVSDQQSEVASRAEEAPVVVGRPRRFRRIAVGLAAAAAVAVVAGSLLLNHQNAVTLHREQLAGARQQVAEIDTQLAEAKKEFEQEKVKLPEQVGGRFVHLTVLGPARLPADAPAPIRIQARDLAGKPVTAQVTLRLAAKGKDIYRDDLPSGGDRAFTLPAGLSQKAGAGQLVVEASTPHATAKVQQTIVLEASGHVTHLALSKSMYQVGEVVFFRTLTLQRFSLKPPAEPVPLQFALVDAQGKTVKQWQAGSGPGGIGGGELPLTSDLTSGTYTLEVKGSGAAAGMAPQQRSLEVVQDLPPRLHFDRAEYRSGQTLNAQFQDRRMAGGKTIANRDLTVKIVVDGKAVPVEGKAVRGAVPGAAALRTDATGKADFSARLPAAIETGKALVEIQAPGGKDKLVQSIPVVGSRLEVEFFPEGGNLVAGVPNRVYYRVRTPLGEPADPEGYVIILSNKDVVLASERNQGLGVFTFTPDAMESYRLRVTSSPRNIIETTEPFKDIGIRDKGVALSIPEAVSPEGKPLPIVLRNSDFDKQLLIIATCRGRIVAQEIVAARNGANELSLKPVAGTRGVVRVTVYEAGLGAASGLGGAALVPLVPVAERLVYRVAAEKLMLALAGGGPRNYKPGRNGASRGPQAVSLRFLVANEKGAAAPAWLLAAVVDDRTLSTADRMAPSPEAAFFLVSQVRQPQDLENADVLLADSAHARHNLDLFLGTQGWRRFVPVGPAVQKSLSLAENKNTAAGSPDPEHSVLFCRENASFQDLQARKREGLQKALAQLRLQHIQRVTSLQDEQGRRIEEARLAAVALADLQARPGAWLRLGLGILFLVLLAAGAVSLVIGLVGVLRAASPTAAFETAFGCLLACLVLYAVSDFSPVGNPTELVARLPEKQLVPEPEQQPNIDAAVPHAGPPLGVFALAPTPSTDSGPGPKKRTNRAEREFVAKADVDRNRDGAPLGLPLTVQMQNRFNEARKTSHDRGGLGALEVAKKGKTAPTSASQNGAGASAGLAREYSFRGQGTRKGPGAAGDGTLLWHPALLAPAGQAAVSFDLPATATSYRILLYGNAPDGRLGWLQGTIAVQP